MKIKSTEHIKPYLLEIYTDMGNNHNEISRLWEEDYTYYVQKMDGSVTSIRRKYIDDYIDSNSTYAKALIERALTNFKSPEH